MCIFLHLIKRLLHFITLHLILCPIFPVSYDFKYLFSHIKMPPPCLGQYLPCVYVHSLSSFSEINGLHIWLQIYLDKAKNPLSSSVSAVLMMAAMC